jgi:hypothetical protein
MKWMIAKGAKSYLEQQQLAYNNDQIPFLKKPARVNMGGRSMRFNNRVKRVNNRVK